MSQRQLTPFDRLLVRADRALRTLSPGTHPHHRPSPAATVAESDADALSEDQKRHSAALMRVNHAGEVCAQALYQGQSLTARLPQVRRDMERAADEEIDHLAWCEERLRQLDSHTSRLNPLWYGLSFAIGAGAGCISDKISLGFVAATEDQVCRHLRRHQRKLPPQDGKSRAIVDQMLEDEAKHSHTALAAGGSRFPLPVKAAMTLVSKVMTKASYRL